ncbi:hypothetical protein JTB14_036759 [Gonioctena quinquepunctata]|nr:hypothetical protein JTB14_036759 [Gonioctena quinquepunctata]
MVVSGEESHYSESGTSRRQQIKEYRGDKDKEEAYRRSSRMTATEMEKQASGKGKDGAPEKVKPNCRVGGRPEKKGIREHANAEAQRETCIPGQQRGLQNQKRMQGLNRRNCNSMWDGASHKRGFRLHKAGVARKRRIQSEYANNAKPTLSGKNVEEAMVKPNGREIQSTGSGTSSPTNTGKYSSETRKLSKERKKSEEHLEKRRKDRGKIGKKPGKRPKERSMIRRQEKGS